MWSNESTHQSQSVGAHDRPEGAAECAPGAPETAACVDASGAALLIVTPANTEGATTLFGPPATRESKEGPEGATEQDERDRDGAEEEKVDEDDHEGVVRRNIERKDPVRDSLVQPARCRLLLTDDRDRYRCRLRDGVELPLCEKARSDLV